MITGESCLAEHLNTDIAVWEIGIMDHLFHELLVLSTFVRNEICALRRFHCVTFEIGPDAQ